MSLPLRHGVVWTAAEIDDLRWLWLANFSVREISDRLLRKDDAISIRLVKEGFAPSPVLLGYGLKPSTTLGDIEPRYVKSGYQEIHKIFARARSTYKVPDLELIKLYNAGVIAGILQGVYKREFEASTQTAMDIEATRKIGPTQDVSWKGNWEDNPYEKVEFPEVVYKPNYEHEGHVLKCSETKPKTLENNMNKFLNVLNAGVCHITTKAGSVYKTKDQSIVENDFVVVKLSEDRYAVAQVESVERLPSVYENVDRWVVQKVNLAKHEAMVDSQKKAKEVLQAMAHAKELKGVMKQFKKFVGKDEQLRGLAVAAISLTSSEAELLNALQEAGNAKAKKDS